MIGPARGANPIKGFAYCRPTPFVAALVERAVAVLADLGAVVEPCDPGFADPKEIWKTLGSAGAAHLARGFTAADLPPVGPAAVVRALGFHSVSAIPMVAGDRWS